MLDAADVVDLLRASRRARTRTTGRRARRTRTAWTRTSGWTRCGWPTSATRSPTQLAEIDPDQRRRLPRQRRRPAGSTWSALDREYADGLAACERSTRRGQPRRVRLPREVRPALRADRRPLPRRRADPGRPRRAPGPDPRRGHHHRLLRAPGSRGVAETLAADLGLETAVLDPIEGLERRDQRTRTTFPSCAATSPPCRRRTDAEPRDAIERAGPSSAAARSRSAAARCCAAIDLDVRPASSWR